MRVVVVGSGDMYAPAASGMGISAGHSGLPGMLKTFEDDTRCGGSAVVSVEEAFDDEFGSWYSVGLCDLDANQGNGDLKQRSWPLTTII
jgi:hypothetical protein